MYADQNDDDDTKSTSLSIYIYTGQTDILAQAGSFLNPVVADAAPAAAVAPAKLSALVPGESTLDTMAKLSGGLNLLDLVAG